MRKWIGAPLSRLTTGRRSQRLWPFSHEDLVRAIAQCRRQLRLESLNMTLHGLRHGGVSHDILRELRPLAVAQERGRWAHPKSLLRYKKTSRAQAELAKLSSAQIEVARGFELNLERVFVDPTFARDALARLA